MVERIPENIEVIGKETLYEKFFRVDEYLLKYPRYNGTMSRPISREVMERGNSAGVLLYDPDRDRLVFVEQFRVGVFTAGAYPWVLECAAGIIDEGETPRQVVIREAKEEAGVTVTDLEPIADYFASPGGISERLYVFCGRVNVDHLPKYAGLENEGEDIRVVVLSSQEVEQMLNQGKFNNALTIIAVQWFVLNKDKLREKWGKS